MEFYYGKKMAFVVEIIFILAAYGNVLFAYIVVIETWPMVLIQFGYPQEKAKSAQTKIILSILNMVLLFPLLLKKSLK